MSLLYPGDSLLEDFMSLFYPGDSLLEHFMLLFYSGNTLLEHSISLVTLVTSFWNILCFLLSIDHHVE